MYNIGICDDNRNICTQIENAVKKYSLAEGIAVNIKIFYSGEDVYECLVEAEGKGIDLLFLDIEMMELDGVELGKKIRSEFRNEEIQIVYISGNQSYAMDLFQVRPMNFLVKPLDEKAIVSMVKQAMNLNAGSEYFSYKIGQDYHRRNLRDILYFESHGRKIKMVTMDEEVFFYEKLKDVLTRIENQMFFPIHKSLVVNYRHIKDFYYEKVVMVNGDELAISQSRRKKVREMQLEYERRIEK